jgi:MFS family permease
MLMIVLDATVVNVALPSIQEDLGFAQASLAWVVNAYLIAFGGLLLLAGRLGDLVSRRGMFLAGLAVFTAASLACGLARSQELLVAARFVQGVGGAMASAVILGMIVTMFPEPREQARAIGVYAFVASAGGSVGLLAGGVLTQAITWHWIFFVNLPIGAVTAFGALRLLEPDRGAGLRRGADVAGAVLVTSALMLLVYTIVEPAAELGWGAPRTIGLGAAGLGLLVAFVAREATAAHPLVPLRIFRSRNVAGANAIQARATLLPGLVLVLAGLLMFTRAPVQGEYVQHALPVMVLLGAGAGLAFPALMALAMSGATPQDAGLASGLAVETAGEVPDRAVPVLGEA